MTWFAVGAALGGARRELTEGILTLVAASMLLFVSHFVLGKLESRKWLKFLERKTRDSSTRPWPLLAVAFVAAYREAIEIVLFFRALALDSPGRAGAIAAGVATGGVILGGARLRHAAARTAAQSAPGHGGVGRAADGAGHRARRAGRARAARGRLRAADADRQRAGGLPTLGLYPTIEGLGTQLVVLALVLFPLWLERRKPSTAPPKLA